MTQCTSTPTEAEEETPDEPEVEVVGRPLEAMSALRDYFPFYHRADLSGIFG